MFQNHKPPVPDSTAESHLTSKQTQQYQEYMQEAANQWYQKQKEKEKE